MKNQFVWTLGRGMFYEWLYLEKHICINNTIICLSVYIYMVASNRIQ